MITSYLSIWDVAHCWNNTAPDATDPQKLPLDIQDTLRFLALQVLEGYLKLHETIIFNGSEELYFTDREVLFHPIDEIPNAFKECAFDRKYDKETLDAYPISRNDLFLLSVHAKHPFPDFWFDEKLLEEVGAASSDSEQPPKPLDLTKMRASVIDKSICQAIAKTLWDINPKINITQMTEHPSILNYGAGKNYQGKNTLRDWLREVAPEHIKNKAGRPKKEIQ